MRAVFVAQELPLNSPPLVLLPPRHIFSLVQPKKTPRPTPKRTPPSTTALDHQAFPHIFDAIFNAADYTALLTLRRTCHENKARVDECLAEHLVSGPDGMRSAAGRLPALYSVFPGTEFFKQARVLDLAAPLEGRIGRAGVVRECCSAAHSAEVAADEVILAAPTAAPSPAARPAVEAQPSERNVPAPSVVVQVRFGARRLHMPAFGMMSFAENAHVVLVFIRDERLDEASPPPPAAAVEVEASEMVQAIETDGDGDEASDTTSDSDSDTESNAGSTVSDASDSVAPPAFDASWQHTRLPDVTARTATWLASLPPSCKVTLVNAAALLPLIPKEEHGMRTLSPALAPLIDSLDELAWLLAPDVRHVPGVPEVVDEIEESWRGVLEMWLANGREVRWRSEAEWRMEVGEGRWGLQCGEVRG